MLRDLHHAPEAPDPLSFHSEVFYTPRDYWVINMIVRFDRETARSGRVCMLHNAELVLFLSKIKGDQPKTRTRNPACDLAPRIIGIPQSGEYITGSGGCSHSK